MDKVEFKETIKKNLNGVNINLSDKQKEQFYRYMEILIEWNKVMNLTRITEPTEIISKHFIDSLMVYNRIEEESKIIDVGSGAGFPGIPLKIIYPKAQITLLDSLNKRVTFLKEIIKELKLEKIEAIHGRAEDYGRDNNYRERYDIAIARAVAPLNILIEYLMPFIKKEGKCILMKGPNAKEEIETGKNAIKTLNGQIKNVEESNIPNTDMKRTIIEITKMSSLDKKYPRNSAKIQKKPL